jgi:hypothetical protein
MLPISSGYHKRERKGKALTGNAEKDKEGETQEIKGKQGWRRRSNVETEEGRHLMN